MGLTSIDIDVCRVLCYIEPMTRTATLTRISDKLSTFDDERLAVVAEIVESMDEEQKGLRQLSARELGLLEQSRRDFAAGRSFDHEEIVAMLDERLAERGVPKSTP